MKFGQKMFLISFILSILVINTIGIIMINYTYEINMNKEIEKNIIQTNNIMRSIKENFGELSYIANSYLKNKVHLDIYIDGKRTYTNFEDEDYKIGENIFSEEEKLTLQNQAERLNKETNTDNNLIKTYIENDKLFMRMDDDSFVILTLTDISEVNKMKQEQIEFFIKLSLGNSLLIAFVLSVSVSFLTRKIKVLTKAVEQIEKGEYNTKVKKLGNDEIGKFGKSFNYMTESIQKNISQIQEVSENRKKFIGNLTHEIRTPLTSIIGYSSLIKSRKVTNQEVIIEYVNKIYEEGKYIEKMSEDLMEMFLIENGKITIEKIDLSRELNKIIEELKQTFPEVAYEEAIEQNIWIDADRNLLKSLIFNLVKNAICSYEKDAIVKIQLNNKKEIKVIDFGKGIPKGELDKIKEPFYTLSKDRNRKLSGMGLGLALCSKIVEIHKGKLEINSTPNIGTEIIIKLGE